jgi:hypothetical protein
MAIVHPAFCVVAHDSMERIPRPGFAFARVAIADTKHCKNRVYSAGTADVFSGSINATRQ